MFTHLIAFAAGAALVYVLCRASAAAKAGDATNPGTGSRPEIAPASSGKSDPMQAPDLDLDAAIIEYITDNEVFHINDVCRAIEHPKGARFVRAHFHQLMEQGKIRYRNMLYTI